MDSALNNVEALTLSDLAYIIAEDWDKPYFGADPYLDALKCVETMTDPYGADDGRTLVAYFLANAITWRGDTARIVKAELKRRLKKAGW
jgi:hypothetical protein